MDNWYVKLFNKSVLKQQKFRYLADFAGDCSNKSCLDLGSDNGVISYLLRQRGGDWSSADLDDKTVSMIHELVEKKVYKINPPLAPFSDGVFDTVVIVDMLEHVADDRAFLNEMYRIIRPGGCLVVHVPFAARISLIRLLRAFLGLTDEQHGHLR
ncbi:Methyltransferase, partial [sediment metagenome]